MHDLSTVPATVLRKELTRREQFLCSKCLKYMKAYELRANGRYVEICEGCTYPILGCVCNTDYSRRQV